MSKIETKTIVLSRSNISRLSVLVSVAASGAAIFAMNDHSIWRLFITTVVLPIILISTLDYYRKSRARKLISSTKTRDTFSKLTEDLTSGLPGDVILSLYTLSGNKSLLLVWSSDNQKHIRRPYYDSVSSNSAYTFALEKRTPYFSEDIKQDHKQGLYFNRSKDYMDFFRGLIAIPIIKNDEVQGVFTIKSSQIIDESLLKPILDRVSGIDLLAEVSEAARSYEK